MLSVRIIRKLSCSAAFDPVLVPEVQIQQSPKEEAIIHLPRTMLIQKSSYEAVVEQTSFPQRGIEQGLLDEASQAVEHPFVDRRAKAFLCASEHAIRYHAGQ